MRLTSIGAILALSVACAEATAGEVTLQPAAAVDRLLAEGCDANPDLVSDSFRSEGGCEHLISFFANGRRQVEAISQSETAIVTLNVATLIKGAQLPPPIEGRSWPESFDMSVDYYFHLRMESGRWRLAAIRSLATPMFVWWFCVTKDPMPAEFTDEFDNMKLMCLDDAQFVEWFEERRGVYESLRRRVAESPPSSDYFVRSPAHDVEDVGLDAALKSAGASGVSNLYCGAGANDVSADRYKDCASFPIAGLVDNTVGVLWARSDAFLPTLSPSSVIMLRSLGEGWWMFKTT